MGRLYAVGNDGDTVSRNVTSINPYLVSGSDVIVSPSRTTFGGLASMVKGNQPSDGGHLCLSTTERNELLEQSPEARRFIKNYLGAAELILCKERFCLWIEDEYADEALAIAAIADRLQLVRQMRLDAKAPTTRPAANWPHRFIQIQGVSNQHAIVLPRISSETREYLPGGLLDSDAILSDQAFALYDAPIWNLAVALSRIHLIWVSTVCGKMETRVRYSNTLGWNTFPVPKFSDDQLAQLSASARRILKTRYQHYPATIAELYDPDKMPDDLRQAHRDNDDLLETMYIGRPFRNDTERLEKLFKLYAARIKQAGK